MKHLKTAALFTGVMLLGLMTAGCGRSAETAPEAAAPSLQETAAPAEDVTDPAPAEAPSELPENVVALSRSIGELWLLAGGKLTGVTEDAMDLPGLEESAVSIGSLAHPSSEAILALNPGMILMTEDMPTHKKLAEEMRGLGLTVRTVNIDSFGDYDGIMAELTGMTGRKDLYDQNVTAVRERIGSILEEAALQQAEAGTYLCMRVSPTKNRVMKQDYFACEIISDFGLVNIAADSSALDELNLEAIAAADPDWIFVIPMGDEEEAMEVYQEVFASQAVWKELSAAATDRIVVLPSAYFMYKPNAKWDEAYRYMYGILYKE